MSQFANSIYPPYTSGARPYNPARPSEIWAIDPLEDLRRIKQQEQNTRLPPDARSENTMRPDYQGWGRPPSYFR